MSIIDLQRRLAEAGRIRIGQQVPTQKGGTRPEKLTTFRLTSADQRRIGQAAQLYGGTPARWQAPAGPQWEVITDADALDVIVPPSDMSFSQHYELWAAGGCQRRCDGRTESLSAGPCVCDADARECDIHTRLSVMLRDLPGLGVWRIDTQGYYAAVELQGAVEVIQMAAGRGQMLPARLRLEQRVVKRPGAGTRRFAVPVLDIEVSPGQLIGPGADRPQLTAGAVGQIDGSVPLTPVPASVPPAPVASVAEQAAAVAQPRERAQRKNGAAPVPSTGMRPRPAAQARIAEPPPPEEPVDAAEAVPMVNREQLAKLHAQLNDLGITDRDSKLVTVGLIATGAPISSSSDLTLRQASRVIDALEKCLQDPTPGKALDALLGSLEQEQSS